MARAIFVTVLLAFLTEAALTILALFELVPFNVWLVTIIPLIMFTLGFAVAFALALFNVISEASMKSWAPSLASFAGGFSVANVRSFLGNMNAFIHNLKPDIGVYILGFSLITLPIGLGLGLYSGVTSRPSLPNALLQRINQGLIIPLADITAHMLGQAFLSLF
jgi:hypothetical protein